MLGLYAPRKLSKLVSLITDMSHVQKIIIHVLLSEHCKAYSKIQGSSHTFIRQVMTTWQERDLEMNKTVMFHSFFSGSEHQFLVSFNSQKHLNWSTLRSCLLLFHSGFLLSHRGHWFFSGAFKRRQITLRHTWCLIGFWMESGENRAAAYRDTSHTVEVTMAMPLAASVKP